ncbi:phospholipase A [Xanthomonas melonis]|uniref:Phospholipase A1 n=1 Tax=Xanthomonas melonis TaxID=56456 RepID=A0A2S7DCP1_9XANT|nr:phospholipase A [Xanthomonas melonis]MCC4600925.1 phospholipase A [Xanthomonas melonis]MCD0244671.1 phospholipase A [Xanthomonas melonis]MCD0256989.1 phospholipase A [Xanthomonas melonis]MCD0265250.1 phospholipase A [Xanthomonas melonis]MCD0280547.1 phospholipase A [Xanthomonas melonis]
MPTHSSRSYLLIALAAAPLAQAQEIAPQPASPQACTSVTSDAARLACYDQALGYTPQATQQADAAAQLAKQAAKPEDARTLSRVGDFFRAEAQDRPIEEAVANAGRGSLLDRRWELAKDSKLGTFQLRGYKPVYLLPAFWTSDTNRTPQSPNPANSVNTPQQLDSAELKFQLSFKTKVAEDLFGDNGDIWMGYTQSSRWQAYNSEASRPFRETNYEPEAMLVFRNNYSIFGWKGRMSGISLNHMSNGRADPLSRSWNRVILNIGLDRENWALTLRPWFRIKEDRADDNNPDIEDYMGRGDATLVYNKNGHEVALIARHSLRGGDRSHGSVQLDYGFPINNLLRGHVQVFDGYGESLIDYNHKATYVGVGVSLLEWF